MFEEMKHRSAREHSIADRSFRTWAAREMRAGRLIFFLAEDASRGPVAGGGVWLRQTQPGPGYPGGVIPYLLSMFTEPEVRGRGIATEIVLSATRWARSRGYPWMTLHASDDGRRIYTRLGWRPSNEMELDLSKPASSRRLRAGRS